MTVQLFNFHGEEFEVRFVGTAEKPEWVAADVCAVLEIERHRDALREFDQDERGAVTIRTPGGEQETLTVTEAGLYRLIFKSRKPQAKAFQRWVMHEVLPSIRKTGSYSVQPQPAPQQLPSKAEELSTIQLAVDLLERLNGLDQRTQLAFSDSIKGIMLKDQMALPSAEPEHRFLIPVSDRVMSNWNIRLSNGQLSAIGRRLAARFRLLNPGEEPLTREAWVDGQTRMVKCYTSKHYEEFGDQVISNYLIEKDLLIDALDF